MAEKGISKYEQAELPVFQSHEEAIDYFEEKYGEKFVFEESLDTSDGTCFFYRLIVDEEAYIKGVSDLNSTGYVGVEFMKSYQPIRIMENGSIHIAH
ncbi:hypothetical protein QOZ98_002296 [Planomicrobium stackebrandtii]|uniref:Uncharacterized protein n=1 Tax=Planomicrobium stackebrandtii TaxID=253160 RepID=A0ABU0GVR8_9BACL|nr:hypothetical protein [Planomicrobium stackebrandtii]MDQ0429468.1 hypothetical protein [Planomicrobium stackebrandtii]